MLQTTVPTGRVRTDLKGFTSAVVPFYASIRCRFMLQGTKADLYRRRISSIVCKAVRAEAIRRCPLLIMRKSLTHKNKGGNHYENVGFSYSHSSSCNIFVGNDVLR